GRRRQGGGAVRRTMEVTQLVGAIRRGRGGGLMVVPPSPPMGFQAIGNKHLPDDRFNEPAYLRSPIRGWDHRSVASSTPLLQNFTRGAARTMRQSWPIPATASGQTTIMKIVRI